MKAIIHATSNSKAQQMEAEEKQNALFDKKLAEEEAWIRQGIKARRTRNEGRVRALKTLREQSKARRSQKAKSAWRHKKLIVQVSWCLRRTSSVSYG